MTDEELYQMMSRIEREREAERRWQQQNYGPIDTPEERARAGIDGNPFNDIDAPYDGNPYNDGLVR